MNVLSYLASKIFLLFFPLSIFSNLIVKPTTINNNLTQDDAIHVSNIIELQEAIESADTTVTDIKFDNNIIFNNEDCINYITPIYIGETQNIHIDGQGFIFSPSETGANEQGILNDYAIYCNVIYNYGNLSLRNMVIRGGLDTAIYNDHGNLAINNCVIERSGCEDCAGGGVLNDGGNCLIKDSRISRNNADNGGGFKNQEGGFMIVDSCSITENRSLNWGGGACELGGSEFGLESLTIVNNSTIANNTSYEIGGGINFNHAYAFIVNSSVVGNITTHLTTYGGGIGNRSYEVLNIYNSAITNNYSYCSNYEYFDHKEKIITSDFAYFEATKSQANVIASVFNIHNTLFGDINCVDNTDGLYSFKDKFVNNGNVVLDEDCYASYVNASLLTEDGNPLEPMNEGEDAIFYRPIIVKTSNNNTYVAPLKSNTQPTVAGGIKTYLAYPEDPSTWVWGENNNVKFGYNENGTIKSFVYQDDRYFDTPSESDLINVYQDGTSRNGNGGAMGAVGVSDIEYCTISVLPAEEGGGFVSGASIYGDSYSKGTLINLTSSPDEGYVLEKWVNVNTLEEYPSNKFINYHLNSDLTIRPVFTDNGDIYAITNKSNQDLSRSNNGYIMIDRSAIVGSNISFAVVSLEGYELESLIVYKTDDLDTKVEVTNNSFIMPNYDITIEASFKSSYALVESTSECFYHWITLGFLIISVASFLIFTFLFKNALLKFIISLLSSVISVVLSIVGVALFACIPCICFLIISGIFVIADVSYFIHEYYLDDDKDNEPEDIK